MAPSHEQGIVIKGVPKKCNDRFSIIMGLPIENSYKTDPLITIPEFSDNNF